MRRVLCICLAILLFLGMVTPMALAETAPAFRTEPMISAGAEHTVALRDDGTVWTWGRNWEAQLGDGVVPIWYRSTPTRVQSLTNVIAVSAGWSHTVALRSDGTVWACRHRNLDNLQPRTFIFPQSRFLMYLGLM